MWLTFGITIAAVFVVSLVLWGYLWMMAAGFGGKLAAMWWTILCALATTVSVAIVYLAVMDVAIVLTG